MVVDYFLMIKPFELNLHENFPGSMFSIPMIPMLVAYGLLSLIIYCLWEKNKKAVLLAREKELKSDCRLQGTKHWAGLTGWADYWLLTARRASESKGLGRDINFFICDANAPGQHIVVEEKFNNLGLYMIPYGRNVIDISIPATHRLIPHSTGVKMMLDLLHRSRMQFPAMAIGFLRRILEDATNHCRDRLVGGKSLLDYDMVQARLAKIQSAFTICSAMCVNTSERAGLENNLATEGFEANAIKTCITDLMQESSQSYLQLVGAKGYRLDHFAGRAVGIARDLGSRVAADQLISE